jgi:putative protein-disulfide isomerase
VAVEVRYYTDPACSSSWSIEPLIRRLEAEFGDSLSWTYVMGGLARDYTKGHEDPEAGIGGMQAVYPGLVRHWLDVADQGGMPMDPRLWTEGPITSTYPACMAVKAAAEQGGDSAAHMLRALREGLMCFRRKLDGTEALVEEARRARLDVERFRVDLGSHAIVESFGTDLEEVRDVPSGVAAVLTVGGRSRVPLPSIVFGGRSHAVWGVGSYEAYRDAALASGAEAVSGPRPSVLEALQRWGRLATREVEAVCGLPGPRASAELWRLAADWEVRPLRVLTGELWELA